MITITLTEESLFYGVDTAGYNVPETLKSYSESLRNYLQEAGYTDVEIVIQNAASETVACDNGQDKDAIQNLIDQCFNGQDWDYIEA